MFRVSFNILIIVLLSSCHKLPPSYFITGLTQKSHFLEGTFEARNISGKINCDTYVKNKLLDKFLYLGFENTPYWRPRLESQIVLSNEIRKKLLENIYNKELNSDTSNKTCISSFQFNVNAILIQLEHENIISPLGY
ncbi:MAG: hypothetical protein IPL31_00045 [Saprospiraceae bacterium]|nr:hypothetical protein [Saprospiraceae bacterium]